MFVTRQGNPLGLGLAIVGAFAMVISAFLPLDEPIGLFHRVQDNTLIQHGGWVLIALALGIAVGGVRANQRGGNAWVTSLVSSVLAALQVFMWATDDDLRTLYRVGPNGAPDTSQPGMVASPGIALYVAGVGVAAALIGSLMLRRTAQSPAAEADRAPAQPQTKKCPDCAETILVDAKVCKHCGFRFAAGDQDAQKKRPVGKSSKVRCHKCQHVQLVPSDQSVFVCEQCNEKLKRRSESAKSG